MVGVLLQISLNLIDKGLLYAPDPGQHETIGLILCPGRDRTVTEWALRGLRTPVAVARYVTGDMAAHGPGSCSRRCPICRRGFCVTPEAGRSASADPSGEGVRPGPE